LVIVQKLWFSADIYIDDKLTPSTLTSDINDDLMI